MTSSSTAEPLSLKGSMFPLTVMDLTSANLSSLAATLQDKISVAPDFFLGSAIVADCSAISESIDFAELKSIVDGAGLYLIGLSGLSDEQAKQAKRVNLPRFKQIGKKRQYQSSEYSTASSIKNIDKSDKSTGDASAHASPADTSAQNPQAAQSNQSSNNHAANVQIVEKEVVRIVETDYKAPKVIEGNIRSGQRLYAEDRDLIIIGNVSNGAEVIADGNIHIYGALRGRALAGAQGNAEAMIVASLIEAQLVSIAGYYKVLEDPRQYVAQGNMRIHLDDTSLIFDKLG